MIESVSCDALKQLMGKGGSYALLDIREAGEYTSGHIPGTTLLPRRDIEFRIRDLVPVRNISVITVGDSGERAKLAATTIGLFGYQNVYVLQGGFPAWMEAGHPTATGVNVPSKEFGEKIHIECAVPEIDPGELHARTARGENVFVMDARTPEEYQHFCIPGGVNVPGGDLILWAGELEKDPAATIVINCAGRTRSIIGTQTLRRLGLSNVLALKNGTMGWLLAGLELEQHPGRDGPKPSAQSRTEAEALAARIATEENIPLISALELRDLLGQRGRRTLYPIDVRSSEEYASGHIPGFLWIPGGQAIQRADDYIAVRNGTVVLTCDATARATMAAYWYRRMGFKDVRVLKGGIRAWKDSGLELEKGRPVKPVLGLEQARKTVKVISAQEAAQRLAEQSDTLILDVATSLEYKAGHLPGAYWISRGWLEEKVPALFPNRKQPIHVTCPNGAQSTLAGATLVGLGYQNISVLQDGVTSWQREGRFLETGLTKALSEPNDAVISASMTGDKSAMLRYLDWEIALGRKYGKS